VVAQVVKVVVAQFYGLVRQTFAVGYKHNLVNQILAAAAAVADLAHWVVTVEAVLLLLDT
jgi:hypothetical protein